MADAAPTEVLQHTEEYDKNLHAKIASHSTEAGHPTNPQSVNPDDQSALEKIRENLAGITSDPVHIASSAFNKHIVGGDSTTYDRTAPGNKVVSYVIKRARRLFHRKEAA